MAILSGEKNPSLHILIGYPLLMKSEKVLDYHLSEKFYPHLKYHLKFILVKNRKTFI